MSNPTTFMAKYETTIATLVKNLEDLRAMNDWIDQDPTLLDRYFSSTRQSPRTDITKADVEAAKGAIGQVLFAYDSGNPTQKSHILKMVP